MSESQSKHSLDKNKKYISDNRTQKGESEDFPKIYDSFDVESLSIILDAQPNLINKRDEKTGWTLLFRSVLNSNFAMAEFLLERNADPNVQNVYGETSLHHAVENSNHKIINLLLEKGANPNLQQMDGETPMHIAAVKGDYKVLKLLNLYGGNAAICTFEHGYTPIDYASERGDKKCVEVLEAILLKQQSFNLSSLQAGYTSTSQSNVNNQGNNDYFDDREGFQTTKNSHSPISRLKNNINMTDQFINMAINQNTSNTAKHSRNPYTHQRNISQNYPSLDINKRAEYLLGFDAKFQNYNDDQFKREKRKSCNDLNRVVQAQQQNSQDEQNDYSNPVFNAYSAYNAYSNGNNNPYFMTNDSNLSPINAKSPVSKFPKRINKLSKINRYGYDSSSLPTYLNYVNLINSHNSRKQGFNSQNEESTRLGGNTINKSVNDTGNRSRSRNNTIRSVTNNNNPDEIQEQEEELLNTRITHGTTQNTFLRTSNHDEAFNLPLKRDYLGLQNNMSAYSSAGFENSKPNSLWKLNEQFDDYNKALAIFRSSKNDIDETYVRRTGIKPTPVELFNFNLEEMNEFIMKTEDNNKSEDAEEDEEEEDEKDEGGDEEDRIMNDFLHDQIENNEIANTKNLYPENLTGTFYSKNFTFKNSESKHTSQNNVKNLLIPLGQINNGVNTSNVKYFSKSGRSMKDEFKQITLDTQNINEVTIYQKGPDSDKHLVSNETLDRMNINFEKIRRNGSGHMELEYNSTEAIREINTFLKVLDLERYTCLFIKHGFDDLSLVVEQMKCDMAITDENLRDIGINVPGHRAKILLKLEEECNNFGFLLPPNVYYSLPDFLNSSSIEISADQSINALYTWLVNLKMEQFLQNFIIAGYQSLDLLFMQMNSKNILTEKILEEEIGINKIGYRIRILNKLRDDSKVYMNRLKNKLKFSDKKEINQESCRCVIF